MRVIGKYFIKSYTAQRGKKYCMCRSIKLASRGTQVFELDLKIVKCFLDFHKMSDDPKKTLESKKLDKILNQPWMNKIILNSVKYE